MSGRFSSNANGGGFVAGANADGEHPSPKGKSDGQNKSLLPVTIKQLVLAKHDPALDKFKIDNVEVSQITFVGVIKTYNAQAANVTYEIEDGTGFVEVREFVNSEESEYQQQQRKLRREDVYVRVIGSLKAFKDKRSVQCYHMHPILDFNEVTYHLLEATHVHLINTRGPAPAIAGESSTSTRPSATNGQSSFTNRLNQMPSGSSASGPETLDSNGFTPLQGRVIQVLRNHASSGEGVHINEIVKTLRAFDSEARIRETVEFLANEGHAFSTIDDQHFKSTED